MKKKTKTIGRAEAVSKPLKLAVRVRVPTLEPKFIGSEPAMKKLADYAPNTWNTNELTHDEKRALRTTLKEIGWSRSQAMLVWATDEKGKKKNLIIDGEHRHEAAIAVGFTEGPVVELHKITRAQAIAWTLRIDKIRGRQNDRRTAKLLDTEFGLFAGREETIDVGLRLGFSSGDLDGLRLKLPDVAGAGGRAIMTGDTSQEDLEEERWKKPRNPVAKFGQLWKLGPHRLLCGDSFKLEHVRRLCGDDYGSIDCIESDPPYAVYGSSTGIGTDIADDAMVRPFFERLIAQCYPAVKLFAHVYIHTDWRSWASVWDASKGSGLMVKNCIVWDKGSGLGSTYANCHEFVAYLAKLPPPLAMKRPKVAGQLLTNRPNVIRIARVSGEDRKHNASKPKGLVQELIENGTAKGGSVLDLFHGGGTTLAVCEEHGRRCFAMDKDPGWIDVAIERWEKATGKKAELLA